MPNIFAAVFDSSNSPDQTKQLIPGIFFAAGFQLSMAFRSSATKAHNRFGQLFCMLYLPISRK